MKDKRPPQSLTPEKFTGIKLGKSKKSAVGIPAIVSSLNHAKMYMNPADVLKTMLNINQKGGFDCPGCAWPDPDDDRSSLGEYCENGMKAIAEEAAKNVLYPSFFEKYSLAELSTLSDFQIGKKGRIAQPMFLDHNATHYKPISWDNAFEIIAQELNNLASPDEAAFYTSGRTSNEAAFLYQLFARQFGTNNLPDCSNMCHESSGKALSQTLGIGKGSVTLNDIHHADVLLIIGQNPGTNHPRMLSALEKCKENGGKIVSVNPLAEAGLTNFVNPQSPTKILRGGTKLSDLFLPIKINGDVAFLKLLLSMLYEDEQNEPNKIFDWDFIAQKTTGFDAFLANLKQLDKAFCYRQCGLTQAQIRQVADMLKYTHKIIVCWAMGLTQHENAVDNIREVVNLLLLKGAIGKPGAGTCPVRGHSNVQGDRTMGIWEEPPQSFLDSIQKNFGFVPPQHHGYSVVDAITAMDKQQLKVFFAMGGNFLSATPDTEFTAQALQKTNLTVQVSTKLNRSHLITGKRALILPCLGRTEKDLRNNTEQFVSVENSMGIVHQSKGVLEPCSPHLLSETEIVIRLAQATFGNQSPVNWALYAQHNDHIRLAIEKTIPGFTDYNYKVRIKEGFYLPNAAREGKFNTPDGKAHFTVNKLSTLELKPNEFLMMTIRSHDQFNTTIYGLDDRYRGIYNERRIVMMNENDMKTAGLTKLSVVNLYSTFNGRTREARKFLVVPYAIPQQCVATYFPEANSLVPVDNYAHTSKTPCSKSVIVTLEKSEGPKE
ncbi:MAG: FdhF/YdeP family oxidoreductase [Sphingobacteriales bacterium]|nr:FdhF/YdeP family oxidoreductase [Sphingobacteriales bacterium]